MHPKSIFGMLAGAAFGLGQRRRIGPFIGLSMHFFSDHKDILIILLVKLGIVASLSALLARSLKFKRTLYAEPRGFQEKLNLVLYWGVPLAIGVGIRNGLGYPAFDLTVEGTFIAGLLGGNVVGLIVGSLVGLTAMFYHEWLALPLAA